MVVYNQGLNENLQYVHSQVVAGAFISVFFLWPSHQQENNKKQREVVI